MNTSETDGAGATRERLVRIGGELFARHGFDGVSVREIVSRAGANLGSITYHFGGKEGLFREVVSRKTREFRARAETEITNSSMGPYEKLRAIMHLYAEQILVRDPGMKVLFAEMLVGGDRLPAETQQAVEWRNKLFSEIWQEGRKDGLFRDCNPETAAWLFFGMLSAYILYQPLMPQGRSGAYALDDVRDVVDQALDLFLKGLCAEGYATP